MTPDLLSEPASLFVEPGRWVLVYALAAGALLAWALRLEAARREAGWRRVALCAAAAGLFLLVARPMGDAWVSERSAILFTAGARADAVAESLPDADLFALAGAAAPAGALDVPDVALLARDRPEVTHWLVAGVGLPEWDLAALPGRVSFVAPAEPRPGIDRATWPRQVTLGDDLVVAGSVMAPPAGATLDLTGPGGIAESVELGAGGSSFLLRARPRREGRVLYRLELSAAREPIASELVDTVVLPRSPPVVLWLEGAPSFETRHVKGWLRDLGGALAVRSQVSRGRFRYEYLNHERVDLSRLTVGLLADFDLLVVDEAGWAGLSTAERDRVAEAVEDGLGLLLAPASDGVSGAPFEGFEGFGGFEVAAVADLEEMEARAAGPLLAPLAPLVIPARELLRGRGQRPVLSDEAGRTLAALQPRGRGTVALTVLEETYRWVLRGESDAHRRYWSHLLSRVSRPRRATADWRLPSGPVLVDEPLVVTLLAGAAWAAIVAEPTGRELSLPLAQGAAEPKEWRGELRPREVGWHRLSAGDSAAWFYAGDAGAWPAWRERRAFEHTARRALLGPAPAATGPVRTRRPWPAGWLVALVMTALAALWGDERWRGLQRVR